MFFEERDKSINQGSWYIIRVSFLEEWKSFKWSMLSNNLDTNTVWDDHAFLLESVVVSSDKMGESELSGDENLHLSWELELGSSEGFTSEFNVRKGASDRHNNLSNGNSCGFKQSFTESTSHTLLESICTSA